MARDSLPDDPADVDAQALFNCAFQVAVLRRFHADSPVREISLSVAGIARRYRTVDVPVREAEALIRDALGERVPLEDIDPVTVGLVHILAFTCLVDEMALFDDEVDAIIVQAEDLAEERGYQPTKLSR